MHLFFRFFAILRPETDAPTWPSSCWSTSSCPTAFAASCWRSCWPPSCPRSAQSSTPRPPFSPWIFTLDSGRTSKWCEVNGTFQTFPPLTRPNAGEAELLIAGRAFVIVLVVISVIWIPIINASSGSMLFTYIQSITRYSYVCML